MYMCMVFFFSSRRRHTRCSRDWSSDVCSSDLLPHEVRRERASVAEPQWEQSPHADAREHPLPVGSDVGEKQVAEHDPVETRNLRPKSLQGGAHARLIFVVRRARRYHHLLEWQAERLSLPAE